MKKSGKEGPRTKGPSQTEQQWTDDHHYNEFSSSIPFTSTNLNKKIIQYFTYETDVYVYFEDEDEYSCKKRHGKCMCLTCIDVRRRDFD